ncbi:hypothetical protein NE852_13890 [Rhizobium sp. Pop5]|uniref:hypothetical protein n=1 Tax=Rhizobium sp. Pop5 TaxID=1223565 RepID=UPI00028398C0|nr:hypothetical protein [Rhizobium sp. Pop5]EJZ18033.1 hypothetical protein RCCGEPOP_27674 [Rhizobium sp. Pop5]UVD55195.1 hypothetical protein NE852_13890 [Rhizobium sp. Pop5]
MGVEIVRVPVDWHHPEEEGELVVGGHHEPLYYMDSASKTAFQLYENVSEGSPVSPVFPTSEKLVEWLKQKGWTTESVEFLLSNGHAPTAIACL